ncbi:hypothetical protein EOA13_15530 [Mesorhizobium sp. M7A.F.Ca.US.011.01.1.1]|uniref:hypothetical protein n=1 Tax=Mesorhizobium sp. M7A.F.Ca.US.011.01.1.1 TaxID=2496741 RepID=UPI000FCBB733|nr:hypothetical protein [Mesorhizobium sp. M7A.F.Ca.US.011.01.1.1]RUX28821.1 hypothetical protein EOA13_15530 [Mesorhizobium sp. M7A.F.Ca.US.011.01.1.1]
MRLNAHLAAETYRRVFPLRRDGSGRFTLGGGGRVVDWLVEMRRLPQGDMLDERIGSGRLAATEINEVGKMLADFYAHCPAEIDGGAYLRHLIREQRINRAILLRPEFAFSDIASGPLDMVDGLLQ